MDADNNPGHQGQSTREGEKGSRERPADTRSTTLWRMLRSLRPVRQHPMKGAKLGPERTSFVVYTG